MLINHDLTLEENLPRGLNRYVTEYAFALRIISVQKRKRGLKLGLCGRPTPEGAVRWQ